MALYTDERRVGVLGMQQAGKSTFITSLVNHLHEHRPGEFPVGKSGTKIDCRYLPPADGTPEFPYDDFRRELHARKWPLKTKALSEYRCQLDFTRGGRWGRLVKAVSRTRLTLTDIPGEWLADLTMHKTDYPAWADRVYGLLDGAYLDAGRDYLRLVEGDGPLEAGPVVAAFKLALARLAFDYMPIVTPSTLLVTPDGKYVPKKKEFRTPEWVAANRFAGLDAGREFAPLPAAVRDAHPALAAEFARHYAAYRDRLVTPLADKYFACDQLVLLIDPAVLLTAGPGAYNGCVQMLATALAHLVSGQNTWQAGSNWLLDQLPFLGGQLPAVPLLGRVPGVAWLGKQMPVRKVHKLAVVASQADRVHRDDRDKFGDLVRQMVQPLLRKAEATKWLRVGYFVCAAVDSSVSRAYPQLEVLPLDADDRPQPETRAVAVSPVPDLWPRDWQPGDYFFPRFAPNRPATAHAPPSHIGLNRVAEFLFDL